MIANRDALAKALNEGPVHCTCGAESHDFCGRCIADALLASGAVQQGSLYNAFMAGAAACYDIPAPRVLNAAYERYTARLATQLAEEATS